MKGAGRDVVLGVGEVNVFGNRVHHQAVRVGDSDRLVFDKRSGEEFMRANIDDVVVGFLLHGDVTELRAIYI